MTSSGIFGSVWVEKSRKSELLCFHPICLKFGIGGNFEMLITKRRAKLKLENDLTNWDFLSILPKIIPITLQQYRCHGDSGCP